MQYGYAGESSPDPNVASLMDSNPREAMRVGLEIFQDRYGLPVTGEMDEATSELMRMPRCGNKDIMSMDDMMPVAGDAGRKKRYLAQGGSRSTFCQYSLFAIKDITILIYQRCSL